MTDLQTAPDFTLPSTLGHDITLSDLQGGNVVLFFYPRDNTKGCTTENIDFSALTEAFAETNTKLFGISKDSMASHEKFIDKKELKAPLLSDEHGDACEKYDVWKEKKMYGKTFMGIERATFLINAQGDIVKSWRKVKVAGHAEEVLEAARTL